MAFEPGTLAGAGKADGEHYHAFWSAWRSGWNVGIGRRRKRSIASHGRRGRTLARASSSATASSATSARTAGIVSRPRCSGSWVRRGNRICFRSRLRRRWFRHRTGGGGLGLTLRRCGIVEGGLQRSGLSGYLFRRFFTPFQLLLHPFTHVGLLTYRDARGQLQPTVQGSNPHWAFRAWPSSIKC